VTLAYRKSGGSDPAASATSVRRESWSWLIKSTTCVRVPVGNPDLGDAERVTVVVGSEVVTARAAAL
jgi:hypothetical protein